MNAHRIGITAVVVGAALGLGACQKRGVPQAKYPVHQPAVVDPPRESDPELVARLRAEFPVGSTRHAVRARAEQLGMKREQPSPTSQSPEGRKSVVRDVEGANVDHFTIREGSRVGMIFSESGLLEDILLNPPLSPEIGLPRGDEVFGLASGAPGGTC